MKPTPNTATDGQDLAKQLARRDLDRDAKVQLLVQSISANGELPAGCDSLWQDSAAEDAKSENDKSLMMYVMINLPPGTVARLFRSISEDHYSSFIVFLVAACQVNAKQIAALSAIVQQFSESQLCQMLRKSGASICRHYPPTEAILPKRLQTLFDQLPADPHAFDERWAAVRTMAALLPNQQAHAQVAGWRAVHDGIQELKKLDSGRRGGSLFGGRDDQKPWDDAARRLAEGIRKALPDSQLPDDSIGTRKQALLNDLLRHAEAPAIPERTARKLPVFFQDGSWPKRVSKRRLAETTQSRHNTPSPTQHSPTQHSTPQHVAPPTTTPRPTPIVAPSPANPFAPATSPAPPAADESLIEMESVEPAANAQVIDAEPVVTAPGNSASPDGKSPSGNTPGGTPASGANPTARPHRPNAPNSPSSPSSPQPPQSLRRAKTLRTPTPTPTAPATHDRQEKLPVARPLGPAAPAKPTVKAPTSHATTNSQATATAPNASVPATTSPNTNAPSTNTPTKPIPASPRGQQPQSQPEKRSARRPDLAKPLPPPPPPPKAVPQSGETIGESPFAAKPSAGSSVVPRIVLGTVAAGVVLAAAIGAAILFSPPSSQPDVGQPDVGQPEDPIAGVLPGHFKKVDPTDEESDDNASSPSPLDPSSDPKPPSPTAPPFGGPENHDEPDSDSPQGLPNYVPPRLGSSELQELPPVPATSRELIRNQAIVAHRPVEAMPRNLSPGTRQYIAFTDPDASLGERTIHVHGWELLRHEAGKLQRAGILDGNSAEFQVTQRVVGGSDGDQGGGAGGGLVGDAADQPGGGAMVTLELTDRDGQTKTLADFAIINDQTLSIQLDVTFELRPLQNLLRYCVLELSGGSRSPIFVALQEPIQRRFQLIDGEAVLRESEASLSNLDAPDGDVAPLYLAGGSLDRKTSFGKPIYVFGMSTNDPGFGRLPARQAWPLPELRQKFPQLRSAELTINAQCDRLLLQTNPPFAQLVAEIEQGDPAEPGLSDLPRLPGRGPIPGRRGFPSGRGLQELRDRLGDLGLPGFFGGDGDEGGGMDEMEDADSRPQAVRIRRIRTAILIMKDGTSERAVKLNMLDLMVKELEIPADEVPPPPMPPTPVEPIDLQRIKKSEVAQARVEHKRAVEEFERETRKFEAEVRRYNEWITKEVFAPAEALIGELSEQLAAAPGMPQPAVPDNSLGMDELPRTVTVQIFRIVRAGPLEVRVLVADAF